MGAISLVFLNLGLGLLRRPLGDDPLADIAARHRRTFPRPEAMVRGALVSGAGERGNPVRGDTRGAANVGQAFTKESCQVSLPDYVSFSLVVNIYAH